MIGQKKLLAELDSMLDKRAVTALPRFTLILGMRGAGHEELARYIANKFDDADYIQLQDVKIDSIRTMIKQAYSLHRVTIFCIPHADDMSINAKNAMLKVVEEVPNKAYFIMCLEDLSNTLATIESRAQMLRMDVSTSDEIKRFARSLYESKPDDAEIDMIGRVCMSEGEVKMMQKYGAKNFYAYAKYVVDNMTKMSGAEVFKLSEKLALKDEEDKYDLKLFLRTLQMILVDDMEADTTNKYTKELLLSYTISKYLSDLRIKGINKTMLMDNLFLEVRRVWKEMM